MATFNGGRMSALLLCMLFSLTASFAQDETWDTVVVYMVDPIDEKVSQGVEDYIAKWNDPLYWETFERDFTPAREGQMAQVEQENRARIEKAEELLEKDRTDRGDGTSSWYPSWIPLALAETSEDSLFKNILSLRGAEYPDGRRQTLREFFELDGAEPYGEDFLSCDDERPRCRKEFYTFFRELVEIHDASKTSETAPRIISFTVQVRASEAPVEQDPDDPDDPTFVEELNEEEITAPIITEDSEGTPQIAEFNYESIRLLQPAVMDPDEYVIDTAPYWQPAAKPVSSETSSWGRIKATFADD